jgi:hypothetical protein
MQQQRAKQRAEKEAAAEAARQASSTTIIQQLMQLAALLKARHPAGHPSHQAGVDMLQQVPAARAALEDGLPYHPSKHPKAQRAALVLGAQLTEQLTLRQLVEAAGQPAALMQGIECVQFRHPYLQRAGRASDGAIRREEWVAAVLDNTKKVVVAALPDSQHAAARERVEAAGSQLRLGEEGNGMPELQMGNGQALQGKGGRETTLAVNTAALLSVMVRGTIIYQSLAALCGAGTPQAISKSLQNDSTVPSGCAWYRKCGIKAEPWPQLRMAAERARTAKEAAAKAAAQAAAAAAAGAAAGAAAAAQEEQQQQQQEQQDEDQPGPSAPMQPVGPPATAWLAWPGRVQLGCQLWLRLKAVQTACHQPLASLVLAGNVSTSNVDFTA